MPRPRVLLKKLEDQNGGTFDLKDEDSLVFVIGGKDVPKETEFWADELEGRLPASCRVIRLLDLQEVPHAGGPLVRRKIRKQIGDQPKRIFLDWDGLIARRFEVRTDIPVIVCLDTQDDVLDVIEGDYSAALGARVESLYPKRDP